MPKRFNRTYPRSESRSFEIYRIRREMGIGRPELGSWVGRSESTVKRWESRGSLVPDAAWAEINRGYARWLLEKYPDSDRCNPR